MFINRQLYLPCLRLLVVTILLCFGRTSQAEPVPVLSATEVATMLAEGGYVLYMRHGATYKDQTDRDFTDLSDCSKQRNLNDEGRAVSAAMGQKITALGIKVDAVLSSPYCRCSDTAQLVFGRFDIDPLLASSSMVSPEESEVQSAHLHNLLSAKPPNDGNIALVAHTANLREATGIWPKPEGVMHIFRPLGNGQYQHAGLIRPEGWGD